MALPPNPRGGRRSTEDEAALRRRIAWDKSCRGWSQYRIAAHLGVSQQQISDDLARYRKDMTPIDREELRRQHHDQLAIMREKLDELAAMEGAPVTAGKDGFVVIDPATGKIVRNYDGRVAAIKEWRMVLDRQAKLADLDENVKRTEATVDVTVHGSVDAELQELARELGLNDAPAEETEQAEA